MSTMGKIGKIYNKLIDAGISPTTLYIYALISKDERAFGMGDKEIMDLLKKVLQDERLNYISAEEVVDRVLDGEDEYPEEEDWY